MSLEAKAAHILAGPVGLEIRARDKRTAELDRKRAQLREAMAALSVAPGTAQTVEGLRVALTELNRERDDLNPRQAKWHVELRAIRERHALERTARARGERIPSLHSDPKAYAA
jgi:hypothetical protein